jgi:biotin carboxyl carrier protein
VELEIEIDGTPRTLSIRRAGDQFAVTIGGRERFVQASQVDAYTLALIIDDPGDPVGKTAGGAAAVESGRRLSHEVVIVPAALKGQLDVRVGADAFSAVIGAPRRRGRGEEGGRAASGPQRINAPMPGKVVRVLAQPGDMVAARQPVVVIEAMKMENELRSTVDGTVTEVPVREGQSVDAGTLLAIITPTG